MEVVVGAVARAPQDLVLSIKAGGVRRQGALKQGMHFVFPQVPEQDAELQLLRPCGGPHRIPVRQLQVGAIEETITLDTDLGEASFGMSALPLDDDGAGGPGALRRHTVVVEAKDYLERHALYPLVQQMMRDILDEKPVDPVAAMVAMLQKRLAPGEPAPAEAKVQDQPLADECERWKAGHAELSAQLAQLRADKERVETELVAAQAVAQQLPPSRANVSTADTTTDRKPEIRLAPEPAQVISGVTAVEALVPDDAAVSPTSLDSPEAPKAQAQAEPPDLAEAVAPALDEGESDGMSAILSTMRRHKLKADSMRDELDEWVKTVLESPEFRSVADDRFDQCDVMQRGFLNPGDIAPLLREITKAFQFDLEPHHYTEFVEIFDLNEDGGITRDEFFAFVQVIFVNLATANSRRLSEASQACR